MSSIIVCFAVWLLLLFADIVFILCIYSKRESLNFIFPVAVHTDNNQSDHQSEIDSIEKYKNDLQLREEEVRRLKVEVLYLRNNT